MLSAREKSKAEGAGSATAINVVSGDSRITFQCALPIVPRPMMPMRTEATQVFLCLFTRLPLGRSRWTLRPDYAKKLGLKCVVLPQPACLALERDCAVDEHIGLIHDGQYRLPSSLNVQFRLLRALEFWLQILA